jgi:hypothetical protein
MVETYKITSYAAIFPMVFYLEDNEKNQIILNTHVDYLNKKVYFLDDISKYPEIDFILLEEQIFEKITPKEIESPEVSQEVIEKANQIRSTDYAKSFTNYMNGEENDSR